MAYLPPVLWGVFKGVGFGVGLVYGGVFSAVMYGCLRARWCCVGIVEAGLLGFG